ncbi:hypothetical protein [Alteribacter natronophilus]|uniref:hypothetical protein n=1 Tax=Alteribacter natronophilus TaxID=2583810 RepID=UPI00110E7BFF|nr:hypothetical protein [Alteribacter natronophilus]TMW71185.1 hypothetical protein FGB90_14600 [Alteribacter natronophilus]
METRIKTDEEYDEKAEVERLIKKHTYIMPRTKLGWVLSSIIIVSFLMVYPGLMWANTAYPFILGMPFTYVWLTFWVHVIMAAGIYAAKKLWI